MRYIEKGGGIYFFLPPPWEALNQGSSSPAPLGGQFLPISASKSLR